MQNKGEEEVGAMAPQSFLPQSQMRTKEDAGQFNPMTGSPTPVSELTKLHNPVLKQSTSTTTILSIGSGGQGMHLPSGSEMLVFTIFALQRIEQQAEVARRVPPFPIETIESDDDSVASGNS